MQPRFWISLCLILLSSGLQAFNGATQSFRGDHIQVQILSSERSLRPGQTQTFALRLVPDARWHVYWKNPGDSGEPPSVQWKQPADWKVGALSWPWPQRIQVGPFYNFGYEGEVILPFTVSAKPDLAGDALNLQALIKWLVCEESCIPGQNLFSWSMPIHRGPEAEPGDWQAVIQSSQKLQPQGFVPAVATSSLDSNTVIVELKAAEALAAYRLLEFFPHEGTGLKTQAPVISNRTIRLEKSSDPATHPVGGLAIFEKADRQKISYEVTTNGPLSAPESLWMLFLLAFLGGFILNMMPCVLPVLAIKVLSLVRESGADPRKIRLGSLAYGAGVLLSFLGLAGLLWLFKAGGEALGWGFQLQSPKFIAALALLFFLMALNFLNLIQPWNALTRLGHVGGAPSGPAGQFLSGVLAVIVASPCTGPFMGVAVGSALTRTPVESLLIFLWIGFGFLSPFLALAWIPGSRRLLPKPGLWMETFREAMAFPLLLTILWLLWVLEKQSGMNGVLWLLAAFVALGFCAWLWQQMKSRSLRTWLMVSGFILPVCAAAIYQQQPSGAKASAKDQSDTLVWQVFSKAKFEQARQKGPVFIDFTAAWCVTCQVNKTLVLNREDVQKAFAAGGIRLLRADWTDYNPEITEMLASLGRQGVPVYALYKDASSPPLLLPEILTPDLLLREIGSLTSNAIKE